MYLYLAINMILTEVSKVEMLRTASHYAGNKNTTLSVLHNYIIGSLLIINFDLIHLPFLSWKEGSATK